LIRRPRIARVAAAADIPLLQALIARSVRALSTGFYTSAQIEAALVAVFGVDTQLITGGSDNVVDAPTGMAAAGGGSDRRALYGGDQMKSAADPRVDPATEPARIRAFFVQPEWARQGLARALYAECSRAALEAGFRTFELMATLPGEPFYAALGFSAAERTSVALGDGVELPLVRMTRRIAESVENRGIRS
jgi:GNAT superfamily N-acetyltransferase